MVRKRKPSCISRGGYYVSVTDDVRKPEDLQITKRIFVKEGSPSEAMEKILKNSPPYTGVYC